MLKRVGVMAALVFALTVFDSTAAAQDPTPTWATSSSGGMVIFQNATCSSVPCEGNDKFAPQGHKTVQVGITTGTATVKIYCGDATNEHYLPFVEVASLTASGVYETDANCLFRFAITACGSSCRVSAVLRVAE